MKRFQRQINESEANKMKNETRIEFFNSKIRETGYIDAKNIFAVIPLKFPQISHEYETRGYLSSITEYGRWIKHLQEIKEKYQNQEKEFYERKLLGYFESELTKPDNHNSYQACQLFNKEKELAIEIHILASKNGYCLIPFFNEGKRLTSEEKIKNLVEELPEEIITDIQEHFQETNLIKILKGRKGLKTVKPKTDGLDYYIWRMTRFNTGIDMSMPIMASMDINAYFSEKIEGKKSYFAISNKSVKKAVNLVDLLVDAMNFKQFGLKSFSGATKWAEALGIPL